MLTDSINARCVQPLPQRDVNAPPPPSTLKSHTAADAQASTQKRKYKLFKVDAVLMLCCVTDTVFSIQCLWLRRPPTRTD